jgi:hypothetical protein
MVVIFAVIAYLIILFNILVERSTAAPSPNMSSSR